MEQEQNHASLRSAIVRELIGYLGDSAIIGDRLRSGEIRRHVVEPAFVCPPVFSLLKREDIVPGIAVYDLTPRGDNEKLKKRADFIHDALKKMGLKHLSEKLSVMRLNKEVAVLQLHGGGYIAPIRNAYHQTAIRYSIITNGARVITPDYRIAPKDPFPAALMDAKACFDFLVSQGYREDQIIVAGDSAGGGMALALVHLLKQEKRPLPKAVIAMSPWTDMTASGPSYKENFYKDPLFGNTENSMINNREYANGHDLTDPLLSPLFGDFHGFCPILLQVGGYEMMLSDTELVAKKAEEAGVPVQMTVYPEMFHIFQLSIELLPEAKMAWREAQEFLEKWL